MIGAKRVYKYSSMSVTYRYLAQEVMLFSRRVLWVGFLRVVEMGADQHKALVVN